jgi:hypothetical protein
LSLFLLSLSVKGVLYRYLSNVLSVVSSATVGVGSVVKQTANTATRINTNNALKVPILYVKAKHVHKQIPKV